MNKAKNKGSVVLGKIVDAETVYIRFIRFFKIKYKEAFVIGILRLIQHLLGDLIAAQDEYTLSMDRTNWQLGSININILMIGLVLENGRFIPVYFELLDKKGNSNQSERIELLELLKTIFIVDKPLVLVADREFVGKKWFADLKKTNIKCAIRVKKKIIKLI